MRVEDVRGVKHSRGKVKSFEHKQVDFHILRLTGSCHSRRGTMQDIEDEI